MPLGSRHAGASSAVSVGQFGALLVSLGNTGPVVQDPGGIEMRTGSEDRRPTGSTDHEDLAVGQKNGGSGFEHPDAAQRIDCQRNRGVINVQPLVKQRDVTLRLGRVADGRCQNAAIAQQNEGFLFERVGLVGVGERAELPARFDPAVGMRVPDCGSLRPG